MFLSLLVQLPAQMTGKLHYEVTGNWSVEFGLYQTPLQRNKNTGPIIGHLLMAISFISLSDPGKNRNNRLKLECRSQKQ